jgi:3',5'-cyclic AMP phosphodiesterase CpdA
VDYSFFRDTPDNDGRKQLANYLIDNRERLDTDIVVITGDLTDSGDNKDYSLAKKEFIDKLMSANPPFQVYTVPGNHDYCFEGLLLFEDLFSVVLALEGAANNAIKEANLFDPSGVTGAVTAKAISMDFLNSYVKTAMKQFLVKAIPDIGIPDDYINGILNLFDLNVNVEVLYVPCPHLETKVSIKLSDEVDKENNNERRRRFNKSILQQDLCTYPRIVPLSGNWLVLLDSMQDKLDNPDINPLKRLAQGRIGKQQLNILKEKVTEFQIERKKGKRLVVCLHHSPFSSDSKGELEDGPDFLNVIAKDAVTGERQVDCLLFGHTTPRDTFSQPRITPTSVEYDFLDKELFETYENNYAPFVNCENLEHAKNNMYPITLLDLGCWQRIVFWMDGSPPQCSWGKL